jgi:hypothetical protein
LLGTLTCSERWSRGVGIGSWPTLFGLRGVAKGSARCCGAFPLAFASPLSSGTCSTSGHAGRTSRSPAGVSALLPVPRTATNVPILEALMDLLSPISEGLPRAVRDSLPPIGKAAGMHLSSSLPLIGRAADDSLASLPPICGAAGILLPSLLPPIGRAADVRLGSLPPPQW